MRKLYWTLGTLTVFIAAVLLVIIPWKMSFAERNPLEGSPADLGLEYETITLHPSDQPIDLEGWWIPADNPVASVLYIHGGNGNKTDPFFGSLDFYKSLHERNFNVLAIDLRNHGASGLSESGRLTFGREERLDAEAGLDWLKAKEPQLPVFAAGISMGGATLIHMVASGVETDGLILVDPILDNGEVITLSLKAILGWPENMLKPTGGVAQWYFNDSEGLADPGDVAVKFDTPILLISDEYDPVTTVDHARALAAENTSVELMVLPKSADDRPTPEQGGWAGHVSAFIRQPVKVTDAIDAFVARNLEAKAR